MLCLKLLPSQSPIYFQVKNKEFKGRLQAITYQSSVFPVPGQTVFTFIQSMLLSVIINSAKFQEIQMGCFLQRLKVYYYLSSSNSQFLAYFTQKNVQLFLGDLLFYHMSHFLASWTYNSYKCALELKEHLKKK